MKKTINQVYVYADESGNSGKNLFDKASPYFYQGAMITSGNLESLVFPVISKYTEKYSVERLHANDVAKKYGMNEVLAISDDLYDALRDKNWKFHCTIIEKSFIPTIKCFDTFFDYYENRAVDPAWIRIEHNRHLILSYLHALMVSGVGEQFWDSLCSQNIDEAKWVLSQLIVMSKKIDNIQISEAIQTTFNSAYTDVARFTFFKGKGKSNYKGHTPNMIGFDSLSQFVQEYCKNNQSTVCSFTHDLSDEFKGQMRENHRLFHSRSIDVDDESFITFEDTSFDLGDFYLQSSSSNPMLQVTDLFLWVIQRLYPNPSKNLDIGNIEFKNMLKRNLECHLISHSNSLEIARR